MTFSLECCLRLASMALHTLGSFSILASAFLSLGISYSYSACLLNPEVRQNSVCHFLFSLHILRGQSCVFPKPHSTPSKIHWQFQNASLCLKIFYWPVAMFPKCLSIWFSHSHHTFKMSNIHYLPHVIHPKLSLLQASALLSHDWHHYPPRRPNQNSEGITDHFLPLTWVLIS